MADSLSGGAHSHPSPLDTENKPMHVDIWPRKKIDGHSEMQHLESVAAEWRVTWAVARLNTLWEEQAGEEQAEEPYWSEIHAVLADEPLPRDASDYMQKWRRKATGRACLFMLSNNLLDHCKRKALYPPESLIEDIMREAHDTPVGEHIGAEKNLAHVQERFHWSRIARSVMK